MDNLLRKLSSQINIELCDNQVKQFNLFYKYLVEKNKVMNLTGITEYDEVVLKHFIDSIIISDKIRMFHVKHIMDVGTGAGFPGIPLKIIHPEVKFTLLDSLNKRIQFLREVVSKLELNDIECIHGRAEDFGHQKEYREQYDLVVSRAVANLASLSEYCLPFVSMGGYFISYKSGDIEDELENSKNAIKLMNAKLEDVIKYTLPESDIQRSIVIIKKEKNTPKKYPRKAGLPTKQPL